MIIHLGCLHIHRIDGLTKRHARTIARSINRQPPRITWAQLWRQA